MDTTTAFGLIAATLEVGAVGSRIVETKRAKSVTGLSSVFLWLAVVLNAGWFAYGVAEDAPFILYPSLLAVAAYAYGLVRVHQSGRGQLAWLLPISLACIGIFVIGLKSPDTVGYLGGVIAVGMSIPQAWRLWRTRDAAGVAPMAWLFTGAFCLAWIAYGLSAGLLPVWTTSLASMVVIVIILAGYVRARRTPAAAAPVATPVPSLV